MKTAERIKKNIALNHIITAFSLIVLLNFNSCTDRSDQIVSASEVKTRFKVDELIRISNLNTSYLKENVVSVEGYVLEINYLNNRQTILLKGDNSDKSSVICDMQKSQKDLVQSLETGDKLIIKGILKGSLNDVILLNCIISNITNQ